MTEKVIYLAGGMGGLSFEEQNNWRRQVKAWFGISCDYSRYKLNVVNPVDYFNFEKKKHASEREVMEYDLGWIRKSDLIIVNFNDPKSLGTMAELSLAYDKRIPIIGLNEKGFDLHPWQVEFCNRIFDNMNEMLQYVADFYLS